jgi:uncharacterized membrane protein
MGGRAAESHGRSISKAVCWRILASLDTFAITLLVTRSFMWAGSIASIESISKVVLYYLHERAWSKLRWDDESPSYSRLVILATRGIGRLRRFERASSSSSLQLPREVSK